MAMEMRAGESVDMSEDLTRAIAPYAMALHNEFLHSHCSSCFRNLPPQHPCVMSCMVCCSVRYCCSDCLSSDFQVHMSSGECCFFVNHLEKASTSCTTEGTSDFRAALRLLYLLEMHGLVSSDSINQSSRIGGLSVSGIREVLEEGGEVSERILEGSMLMLSARKMRTQNAVVFLNGLTVEIVALWAVMINSVEVQICEGRDLGIAVYGPNFSWFNHSCFPNASYNFVLAPWNEDSVSDKPPHRAVPASKGVASDAEGSISQCTLSYWALYWLQWRGWQFEDGFTHGISFMFIDVIMLHLRGKILNFYPDSLYSLAVGKYGPRVVVRCTKPINKGDEVCITYIDLIQTREARHSDLWSKYKFICFCKRCTASPEPYVDLILNCYFRNLNSLEDAVMSPAIEDLDDILQQAISKYSLGDDPKACCDIIESMLSNNWIGDLQQVELSRRRHMLHPLHHICLRAYMALASAYRFCALKSNTDGFNRENSDVSFKMTKAAAAYSFVLAGATHHLFLSESCFMTPLSHFLLSTGQSMLDLVQCMKGGAGKNVSEAKFSFASCSVSSARYDSIQHHQFRSTCEDFGKCMLSLSLQCWPFLAQSSPCLEKIKNPIDFSWLGTTIFQSLHLSEEDSANLSYADGLPIFIEEQKGCVLSLAVCCINFCKYLASICYGPQHYLTIHAKDLLETSQDEYDRSSYGRSGANDDEGGYNKTSEEDYGCGTGGFNKSSNDNNDGEYKNSNTDVYGGSGGYNKSGMGDFSGGLNKSSTDDYGASGGYNNTSTDDYSASGDYKSSTDDFSGGHNKSTDDYSGSGGYKKSSAVGYDSGYKNSSTEDGYGGSGYKKPSTEEDSYTKSTTEESAYDKSSIEDYGGSGYNKPGADEYTGGYNKSSADEYTTETGKTGSGNY